MSIAAGFFLLRPGQTPPPAESGTSTVASRPEPPVAVASPEPPTADPEHSVENVATPPPAPGPPTRSADELRDDAHRLLGQGNVTEGLEALKKAVELDPSARNQGELGDLLVRLTLIDSGIRYLRRAADLEPASADRWIALANAYYLKPNPGEAWKAERKAREVEPGLRLGRDAGGLRIRGGDSAATDQ